MKPVQDLRQDLRDGVILAYLIEIVGQLALDSDASVNQNMASYILHMPFRADCFFFKINGNGTSLVVQWLRVCTFTARGRGLIPGRGTKIPHTAAKTFF